MQRTLEAFRLYGCLPCPITVATRCSSPAVWEAPGFPARCTLFVRWPPEETTCLNKMWMHHILKYNVTTPLFLQSGSTTRYRGQEDDHHMLHHLTSKPCATTASPILGCPLMGMQVKYLLLLYCCYLRIYRICKTEHELNGTCVFPRLLISPLLICLPSPRQKPLGL